MATDHRDTRRNGKMALQGTKGPTVNPGRGRTLVNDLQTKSDQSGVQSDIENGACSSCGSHHLDPGASWYPPQCHGPKDPRCAFLHGEYAVRSQPDE